MSGMARSYVVYTRVSTQAQDENTSQSRQVETCKRWGEEHGWMFLEHVHDTQTGKSYAERAGVRQVLRLLESGRVTDVICWSVDRTGREAGLIQQFFKDIYLNGGRVSIVSKRHTYNTFNEIRKDTIFEAAVADYERTTIIERLHDGKMYAFEKIGSFIYPAPYGYEIKEHKIEHGRQRISANYLIPHPYESQKLAEIIETYIKTKSIMQTVQHVNKTGIKTKRGGMFGSVQLKDMLDRVDIYAGRPDIRTLHGVTKSFNHPPLITKEQADRVKEIRDTVPRIKKGSTSEVAPFYKLITCQCCGGIGQGSKGWTKGSRSSYGIVCNSLRIARNKRNYLGADTSLETVCKSQIALSRFIETLHAFLTKVDVNHIESQFEYEVSTQITSLRRLYFKYDTIKRNREVLKNQQADIVSSSAKLSNTDDFTELAGAFNEQLKELRINLTEIDNNLNDIKDRIDDKHRLMSVLGIPLDEINDYVLPTIDNPTMTTFISFTDIPNVSKFIKSGKQHEAIQLHKAFIDKHSSTIRNTIKELTNALEAEEYETVNGIMRKLGLRFTADFSESNKITRTGSVRVLVDFEGLEELLRHSGVSPDYPQTTSGKKGTYSPPHLSRVDLAGWFLIARTP